MAKEQTPLTRITDEGIWDAENPCTKDEPCPFGIADEPARQDDDRCDLCDRRMVADAQLAHDRETVKDWKTPEQVEALLEKAKTEAWEAGKNQMAKAADKELRAALEEERRAIGEALGNLYDEAQKVAIEDEYDPEKPDFIGDKEAVTHSEPPLNEGEVIEELDKCLKETTYMETGWPDELHVVLKKLREIWLKKASND